MYKKIGPQYTDTNNHLFFTQRHKVRATRLILLKKIDILQNFELL